MPINNETKEAIDTANAAAAATVETPEQPAAQVKEKKPFYKKGSFWVGATLFAAAAAGIAAWFFTGGDAATVTDTATDAANA